MRMNFPQGVPEECIHWLWENVGQGNVNKQVVEGLIRDYKRYDDDWFYDRIEVEIPSEGHMHDSNVWYVPTITIKDPKKAVLFILRWG